MYYLPVAATSFANPRCRLCQGLSVRNPYSKDPLQFSVFYYLHRLYSNEIEGCTFCTFIRAIVDHVREVTGETDIETGTVSADGITGEIVETDDEDDYIVDSGYPTYQEWYHAEYDSLPGAQLESSIGDLHLALCELTVQLSYSKPGYRGYKFSVLLPLSDQDEPQEADGKPWLGLQGQETVLSGSTASDEAVAWARARLEECHDDHELCREQSLAAQQSQLPRRVLHIPKDGDIRLLETDGERATYACLSHCWGRHRTITTTYATLDERKKNILFNDLSRTFQDTITLLRKLDIEYVWIDSLCIIQDSEADWREESAKMAAIYSNAYITIAATRASDGSKGLFSPTELNMEFEGTPIVLHKMPEHFSPQSLSYTFPLLTRAWVAQEMMLSQRVLHFCDGDLALECKQDINCICSEEDYIDGKKPAKKLSDLIWSPLLDATNSVLAIEARKMNETQQSLARYARGDFSRTPVETAPYEPNPRAEALQRWQAFIKHYARLNITFEKDRLPAMSGLVRAFAAKYHTTYAAGLWHEGYCHGLLWSYDVPGHRATTSSAPTWSWASVMSTYTYSSPRGDSDGEVKPPLYIRNVSIVCDPLGSDPYGQLKAARLELEGTLLNFEVKHYRNPGTEYKGIEFLYHATFSGRGGFKIAADIPLADGNGWIVPVHNNILYGLPINQGEYETGGLLLRVLGDKLVDGEKEGDEEVFERVGYWRCKHRGGYYKKAPGEWSSEKLHPVLLGRARRRVVIV